MYYGCKPSKLDGTEIIVDEVLDTMDIPNEYNYIAYLPDAYDQGSRSTCVPHAISAFVDWYNGVNGIDKDMSIDWIYDCRENKDAEGMTLKEALKYIKENDNVTVKFLYGKAFSVEPENFVELKVIEAEPGVKGNTATNVMKNAKVETGAVIQVPMFVEEGETIRIDTRTGEYMSRV